ncbi:Type IIA topoisomerase, A subunit [uncultured Candidatus Thioglobus sp.]|nr:Type IIA topoisomerase, A subunit [uncultured Candidatus Thioglobus sp.]
MAKRDLDKSARNRIIQNIKNQLRDLLPEVIKATEVKNEASLNAKIGSLNDCFIDLKQDVIHSHDEFINKWLQGLKASIDSFNAPPRDKWIYTNLKKHEAFREYILLFLKRSYLNHFDDLSKKRPAPEDSILWIGQTNANYGLLVTPRFNNGQWENDKSKIRTFKSGYWTIGHVMKTGLVIPGADKTFTFANIDQFLLFFTDTLVRNSGSQYEYALAEEYSNFVLSSKKPLDVPLLIPEFRYMGLEKRHVYRLDFMIINPFTLDKVGFELSPWSTHGYLRKTKELNQKQINELAQDNFEKEMKRHRDYFRKHEVFTLIYTDEQLKDCKKLFSEQIAQYLMPEKPATQLSFQIMEEFL